MGDEPLVYSPSDEDTDDGGVFGSTDEETPAVESITTSKPKRKMGIWGHLMVESVCFGLFGWFLCSAQILTRGVEKLCGDKNKNRNSDLLDVLLDYKSNKEEDVSKELSRIDIKDFFRIKVQGTDTTPSTIEWGMAEILRHPETHKKVIAKLDEVVGKILCAWYLMYFEK
ncbi:hypothetical protein GIB67_011960 [Kingdonia uniflora]|uniref:Uncharacterized protein n=1 Tax=Kingdonia uniflora TaxID=39325 RepID=A0A7J7LZY6_9MAGN|nr:hypothetical protein GIB67_011960 [Kingdonia uniflora]